MKAHALVLALALAAGSLTWADDKVGDIDVEHATREQLKTLVPQLEEIRGEKLKVDVKVKSVTEETSERPGQG